jgi:anti-sigma B factor antagonist
MSDVRHLTDAGDPEEPRFVMELLHIDLVAGEPPVLRVEGEIDMATADQLRTALSNALSDDATVVVDMAGVTFIDVSGIRVLLETAASRDGLGPLTLVNAGRVSRLLGLLGLDDTSSIEIRNTGERHGC